MPDRIEPPRFDRLIRRAKIWACAIVVLAVLPFALWWAGR